MVLMNLAHKFFHDRGLKLPVVCIFGCKHLELFTPREEAHEERRLDCRCYPSDSGLESILVRDKPDVLITIGSRAAYPHLANAPFEIRKRWLHYDTLPDLEQLGLMAYNHYVATLFGDGKADAEPLVTVFTAPYRTGRKIRRPFRSLQSQTYTNWEWIIVDDSDDDGKTFKMLSGMAGQDHRMQVFKP